jgi:hypothetical protein
MMQMDLQIGRQAKAVAHGRLGGHRTDTMTGLVHRSGKKTLDS